MGTDRNLTKTYELDGAGGWIGAVALILVIAYCVLRLVGGPVVERMLRPHWGRLERRTVVEYGVSFMELWPVLERVFDEPSRRRLDRSASRCTVALGRFLPAPHLR